MNKRCSCLDHLGMWVCNPGSEKVYENLYQCIDCGKDYLLKDGKYKFISKSEFRIIIIGRKNQLEG